jgi:hypothetical protein
MGPTATPFHKIALLLLLLTTVLPALAAPVGTFACPAVAATGQVPPRDPPLKHAELKANASLVVPTGFAAAQAIALNVTGRFESGSGDPWLGVGSNEEISVGYLQWNWKGGTGSLADRQSESFLSGIAESDVVSAPEPIRAGLIAMKRYSANININENKSVVQAQLLDWTTARPDDPVSGSFRKSVTAAWQAWLSSPPVRAHQRAKLDRQMRNAYLHYVQWRKDLGLPDSPSPDVRTLTYFFDLLTFNGGPKGLWVEHVRAFEAQFTNKYDLLIYVADWLDACDKYQSDYPGTGEGNKPIKRFLYGSSQYKKVAADALRADIVVNSRALRQAVQEQRAFSQEQMSLFVHGFLLATRVEGKDPPRGFPGIYAADVLARRMVVALGIGKAHGDPAPAL